MPLFIPVHDPRSAQPWTFDDADLWAIRILAVTPAAPGLVAVAPLPAIGGFLFGVPIRDDAGSAQPLIAAWRTAFPALRFGDACLAPIPE